MHETEESGELPGAKPCQTSALACNQNSDRTMPVATVKCPWLVLSELRRPSRSAESKPCERPLAVLHPETAGHPG